MNVFRFRRSQSVSDTQNRPRTLPLIPSGPLDVPRAPSPSSQTPTSSEPLPIVQGAAPRYEYNSFGQPPAGGPGAPPDYTAEPVPSLGAFSISQQSLGPGSLTSPRRDSQLLVRDYFGSSPSARGEALGQVEEDDDDDPLVPRQPRPPPVLNLRPLPRRNTVSGTAPDPLVEASSADESDEIFETVEVGDDPVSPEAADTSLAGSPILQLPPEPPPPPPASDLPIYSAHLHRDELRLISSAHLDENHPAAAYFNEVALRHINPPSSPQQSASIVTGSKKLRLILTRGGRRTNMNGTGPVSIRIRRDGVVEGRVEVGSSVEHGIKLEISLLGLVNTSYYVRGQYTLIDTLPLMRRSLQLFPALDTEGFVDAPSVPSQAAPRRAGLISPFMSSLPVASPTPQPRQETATGSSTSTTAPDASADSAPSDNPNSTTSPTAPSSTPATTAKDVPTITPGSSFDFSLPMPHSHYRGENIELPPSCAVMQVGMQSSVEYVLRVKLTRKGWRMNETLTLPVFYEPQAFISPRRLRQITTEDPLNPGWRTIPLNGGAPSKGTGPGVEVSLLLPSPPILFMPVNADPPAIPFHLHFHSNLPLPLATFSDPRQSHFIIRLMRVATMRIGTEREIRRTEIPSKVEIWQEGGGRIPVGEARSTGGDFGLQGEGRRYSSHAGPTTTTNTSDGRPAPLNPPTAGQTTEATRPDSSGRPTSSGSGTGERRMSFLRRRSMSTSARPSTSPSSSSFASTLAAAASPLSRAGSHPPPVIVEDQRAEVVEETPLVPLSMESTDVHLLGELKLNLPQRGPDALRRLIGSFMTPEIGISYLLEVGLQPKQGSIKEAFKHVWGGGMIEVVVGR